MGSKDFKQTIKNVSRNFRKYTQAMESDIQMLIASMLDIIETKISTLRKLLKLKLCIKNVRNIARLEHITNNQEDTSVCSTYSLREQQDDNKKCNDSLEDLSSDIYDVDKHSLPPEENSVKENKTQERLKYLEDVVDIESLCSALNQRNSKMNTGHKNYQPHNDSGIALDKYIYLLLDSERLKGRYEETSEYLDKTKNQKIGDFISQLGNEEVLPTKPSQSKKDIIYLEKIEYDSIVNILDMVLTSYKMQEELTKRSKIIEKTRTEPFIRTTSNNQPNERKIVSDSTCQLKDNINLEKKPKNRKYGFV